MISRLKQQRANLILRTRKDRAKVSRKRDYLKKIVNVLCDKSSSAYSHPVEKTIRLMVHGVAIFAMLWMIIDATAAFVQSPTETTVETYRYPMQKIDYPAIAVCSINRISRKAAIYLAEELLEFETTTYNVNLTVDDLLDMLRLLGYLYDFDLPDHDVERVNLLHMILERGYNGYSVERIMKRLTPNCQYLIRKCSWAGKEQSCADLFYMRRTENGYCCVFNYIRRNDRVGGSQDSFLIEQAERSANVGVEYGLSVFLNPQIEDHVYKILSSHGFKVLIYLPLNYPDSSTGGLKEIVISPRTENFLDMDAVSFYSVPDVEQYDIHKRDCLFSTEQSRVFHGRYSFSDCIMYCKTKDIVDLCKCIPFFYPIADDTASVKTCDLKDLPCLKTYKDRWYRYKPRYEPNMQPFNEEELGETTGFLNCNCLPACQDILYSVSATSIPLRVSEIPWGRNKFVLRNHSIVHIYFGQSGAIKLRQDVLFYWYELMSNYGGICSLFLGISIINLIELFYSIVVDLYKLDQEEEEEFDKRKEDEKSECAKPIETVNETFLYWDEITRSAPKKDIDLSIIGNQEILKENLSPIDHSD